MDARRRRVDPGHADLRDGESTPAGEPDELDVVGEAVDTQAAEQLARDLAAQELEAALGVADSAAGLDDRARPCCGTLPAADGPAAF